MKKKIVVLVIFILLLINGCAYKNIVKGISNTQIIIVDVIEEKENGEIIALVLDVFETNPGPQITNTLNIITKNGKIIDVIENFNYEIYNLNNSNDIKI